MLVVITILRFTGEGHIFFVQERIGLNSKKIRLIKFVTMLKNSPYIGTGTLTIKDDPRVLPFGKFLRKTKINEIPQLFNIVFGDMSIIGPRPLTKRNFNMYSEHARKIISRVKPGLSGIGSIFFRNEEELIYDKSDPTSYYADVLAPYKADLEIWFVENKNLFLYFKCIILTIVVLIKPSYKNFKFFFKDLPKPSTELSEELSNLN